MGHRSGELGLCPECVAAGTLPVISEEALCTGGNELVGGLGGQRRQAGVGCGACSSLSQAPSPQQTGSFPPVQTEWGEYASPLDGWEGRAPRPHRPAQHHRR